MISLSPSSAILGGKLLGDAVPIPSAFFLCASLLLVSANASLGSVLAFLETSMYCFLTESAKMQEQETYRL